jgi:hypothetical protein
MRTLTAVVALVAITMLSAGCLAQSALPYRAYAPNIASDGTQVPAPTPTVSDVPPPPPPGEGYCSPSGLGIPNPPDTVFGLLTINGEPAPRLTLVTLTFDGHPGISAYTSAAGGYRVDYAAGGQGHQPPCINQFGAAIGVLVNGQQVATGVLVGDPVANPILRFDVTIP